MTRVSLVKRSPRLFVVLCSLLGSAAACGRSSQSGSVATTVSGPVTGTTVAAVTTAVATIAPPTTSPTMAGNITVFAAASLTDSFKEIGAAFTKVHPDAKVTFSFDASSALAAQIAQGAPADLFASADTANMDKLTAASLNGETPVVFATNLLSIMVPTGNPKRIMGQADLVKAGLKVVLCDPSVPCGKYAKQSLDAAKVAVTPASLEQNVKGVVTKVIAGEADAGIVYATDVKAAGDKAAGVAIPIEVNVVATYPIASVKTSKLADVDRAFVAFVTGFDGQAILAKYGFGKP